ncbi:response regulator [Yunchengibacter salinarum]|uniref:response regulator n=1 Tax=Yunchengibacter salinarum TaxID=3133399 RepID=UPI0035B5F669
MDESALFKRLRVLVAMDGLQVADGVKEALKAAGTPQPIVAANHKEAREQMASRNFNMVFMEDVFPDSGGVEFARFLRMQDPPIGYAPILMAFRSPRREDVMAAINAGVNHVCVQPLSGGDVVRHVTACWKGLRPFILAQSYVGPCRRRKDESAETEERRSDPPEQIPPSRLRQLLLNGGE